MTETSNTGFAHPRIRPGGRSERVRRAVLAATLNLMLDKGFASMTIPDIAREAGVHPTTIYRRWGSKGMVAIDAIAGVSTEIAPAPDTGSLRGDMHEFVTSIAGALRVPQIQDMVASLAGLRDEAAVQVRDAYWQARYAIMEKIFEQAIARGEIDQAPDIWETIEIASAPIWMRAIVTDRKINRQLTEDLVDRAMAFIGSE